MMILLCFVISYLFVGIIKIFGDLAPNQIDPPIWTYAPKASTIIMLILLWPYRCFTEQYGAPKGRIIFFGLMKLSIEFILCFALIYTAGKGANAVSENILFQIIAGAAILLIIIFCLPLLSPLFISIGMAISLTLGLIGDFLFPLHPIKDRHLNHEKIKEDDDVDKNNDVIK